MIQFDFSSDQPIYIQLVEQLELYIISGKISPGEKLPSVRDLAMQAQVNPNTMQRALAELEELRLVYTERTNGKYITDDQARIEELREHIALTKIAKFLSEMADLGADRETIIKWLIKQGDNNYGQNPTTNS